MNKIEQSVRTIEEWLGRDSHSAKDPCRPSCAFMMTYEALEAIRDLVDETKAILKTLKDTESAHDTKEAGE